MKYDPRLLCLSAAGAILLVFAAPCPPVAADSASSVKSPSENGGLSGFLDALKKSMGSKPSEPPKDLPEKPKESEPPEPAKNKLKKPKDPKPPEPAKNMSVSSSNRLITMSVQNMPLGEVLEKLQGVTGQIFIIDDQWKEIPVSVALDNVTLDKALKRILVKLNHVVIYGANDQVKIVVLGKDEPGGASGRPAAPPAYNQPAPEPPPLPLPDETPSVSTEPEPEGSPAAEEPAAEEGEPKPDAAGSGAPERPATGGGAPQDGQPGEPPPE